MILLSSVSLNRAVILWRLVQCGDLAQLVTHATQETNESAPTVSHSPNRVNQLAPTK